MPLEANEELAQQRDKTNQGYKDPQKSILCEIGKESPLIHLTVSDLVIYQAIFELTKTTEKADIRFVPVGIIFRASTEKCSAFNQIAK